MDISFIVYKVNVISAENSSIDTIPGYRYARIQVRKKGGNTMTNRIDSSHIERPIKQYQPAEKNHAVQDSFQTAMQRIKTDASNGANRAAAFTAWEDCVRGIRIEFNGKATHQLTNEDAAQFKLRYRDNPSVENMWRILGEMTQIEALDGEAVYDEMMRFYRNEQYALQYGGSAAQFDVNALISGLEADLRSGAQIPRADKTSLLEMIRLIAG